MSEHFEEVLEAPPGSSIVREQPNGTKASEERLLRCFHGQGAKRAADDDSDAANVKVHISGLVQLITVSLLCMQCLPADLSKVCTRCLHRWPQPILTCIYSLGCTSSQCYF